MGKISIINGEKNQITYQKKRWKEWCILNTKDDNGTLKIMVENTSFTGSNGCELIWNLTVSPQVELTLAQDAGTISGKGTLKNLKVDLAAGNLEWVDSNNPLAIQVSAGNVNFKNARFPESGKSLINVATGNVSLTSPPDEKITSVITTAVGPGKNEFEDKKDGHLIEINVALGKASHIKLK